MFLTSTFNKKFKHLKSNMKQHETKSVFCNDVLTNDGF